MKISKVLTREGRPLPSTEMFPSTDLDCLLVAALKEHFETQDLCKNETKYFDRVIDRALNDSLNHLHAKFQSRQEASFELQNIVKLINSAFIVSETRLLKYIRYTFLLSSKIDLRCAQLIRFNKFIALYLNSWKIKPQRMYFTGHSAPIAFISMLRHLTSNSDEDSSGYFYLSHNSFSFNKFEVHWLCQENKRFIYS